LATLNDHVKGYIVRALACYDTPSQVIAAVKEEFGIELSRQQVATYNPENVVAKDLAKKWRDLFDETREAFKKETGAIAIANQSFRLRVLDRLLQKAERAGNMALVAQLIEQASKEIGGAFTNKRELTGAGGRDLVPASGVLAVPLPMTAESWEAAVVPKKGKNGRA
jgi:hypothetical protein